MIRTRNIAVLGVAVFGAVLGTSAMANSMWQIIEFDEPMELGYISCLGEELNGHVWYTIKLREFETPSGNSHLIYYWTWESEWIGQSTSRVWISSAKSPGAEHASKGEVGQWTSHELALPVVGDGPRFRYNMRAKYTVNANGELKVFVVPPESFDDWLRCLGPDK